MLIPFPFSERLRELRLKAGLSQAELAARAGLCHQSISHYELGNKIPTDEVLVLLAQSLGISAQRLTARSDLDLSRLALPTACELDLVVPCRFLPTSDRPAAIRFYAALHEFPEVAPQLFNEILARPDAGVIQKGLKILALDSCDEALVVSWLVHRTGQVVMASPVEAGFRQRSVLNPANGDRVGDCRMPAILRDEWLFFVQPTLEASPKPLRVDFLVRVPVRRGFQWGILEVDGPRHESDKNEAREKKLEMGTARVRRLDLVRADLLHVIQSRLRTALGLPKAA